MENTLSCTRTSPVAFALFSADPPPFHFPALAPPLPPRSIAAISLPTTSPCLPLSRPSWRSPPSNLVRAESKEASGSSVTTALTEQFKKVLLPIIDRNPYLSEATRQAAAATTALARKYGAEITVVVIDEDAKESISGHNLRMDNIRWHLAEGGFEEFGLIERLGEGKRPAAVIGEVADDLSLDLVVLSMEMIHSKHIDGNLLAEFVPCPILLLPL